MTPSRWLGKAQLWWERARNSLWFIPSILVVGAIALSTGLLRLDGRLGTGYAGGWWLFGGRAEGARTVLSVIAGSLITVVAVAFSMTMIALQQASAQFSPRVLRSFTSDRGNQTVLGVYMGTFTYALLVLRTVRDVDKQGAGFVPAISISTAMLLALVSLGLLVYFVHHVAEAQQVSTVLSAVRHELDKELSQAYPSKLGSPSDESEQSQPAEAEVGVKLDIERAAEVLVTSDEEGYLRRIDEQQLAATAEHGAVALHIEVEIGNFVRVGDIVVRAACERAPSEALIPTLRRAFQLDRDRSMRQDPMFGIRQMVDIAVKAVTGINDPTTAEQALDQLAGALTLLSTRKLPDLNRILGDGLTCTFRSPTFADFASAAFAQVRRAARSDLHVSLHLLELIERMLADMTEPGYAQALRHEHAEVLAGFDRSTLTDAERTSLLTRELTLQR